MIRAGTHRMFWFVACLTAAVTATVPVSAQQRGQLFVEVLDASGQPVVGLTPSDFKVEEDGVQATIVAAELGTAPMKIVLLVDNGGRIAESSAINPLRDGLAGFLTALPPEHEVGLFTIGRNIQRRVDFTTDRAQLHDEAGSIFADRGAGLRLLDGVSETWKRRFGDDEPFPVFVLVLTDGPESSGHYSDTEYNELVDQLAASGAAVHAVEFVSRGGSSVSQYAENMAQGTGGSYSRIAAATAFEESLSELATRLGAHFVEVSKRYRVLYERPDPPGARITLGVTRSGVSVKLFADRRMPEQ